MIAIWRHKIVRAHVRQGIYIMARTSRTRPEKKRICNLVPSSPDSTKTDWHFADAIDAGVLGAPARLPASLDLRKSWWTINDQGDTGSCVGWASTDGVARYMFVTAGRLTQATKLSPRFTWMACKETDDFTTRPETMIEGAGTTLKAAVDILRKYGAVPETLLPFKIGTAMYTGSENKFYATAAKLKIASYFNLRRNFANWRAWLAETGPILVGLNVDATCDDATATSGKLDTFKPDTVRGGHAVAVVGYTRDKRFIIRNSWGTGWGDKGFGYASEAYINGAFFDESYGVTL
jgi:C1A family cysteine protease